MRLFALTLALALALALASLALALTHATNSVLVTEAPSEAAVADLRAFTRPTRAAAPVPVAVAAADSAPAPVIAPVSGADSAPAPAPAPGPAPAPAQGPVAPMRAAEPIAAVVPAAPEVAGSSARAPRGMDLVESAAKVGQALGVVDAGAAGAVSTSGSVAGSVPAAAPAAEANLTSFEKADGGHGGNGTAGGGLSLWGGLGIGGGGEKVKERKGEDVGMGVRDDGQGRGGGGGGGVVVLADVPPSCSDGVCLDLGLKLLEAVEGDSCRSLLSSGRCPKACAVSLADVTQHATWPVCAISCRKDIVEGAAERWAEMCEKHAETLLDQGKDVVKKLQAGTAVRHPVLKALLGLSILFAAIGLGYSRGSISAVRSYRAHRRMRMRKSSMDTLPLRSGSTGTRFGL